MNRDQLDSLWTQHDKGDAAGVARLLADSTDPSAAELVLRGIARLESGKYPDAVKDLSEVLDSQPENPVARLYRGLARYHCGQHRAAAADFTSGPLFPGPPWVKLALRTFWPLRHEHPALWTAGEQQPAEVRLAARAGAASRQGVRFFLSGRRLAALPHLERAQQLDPDNVEYRVNLSWCQLHLGQGDRAHALLEPLIEKSLETYLDQRKRELLPHANILSQWAWALHETGEHRGALAVLSTIRPEGPEDYLANTIAALCWDALERPAEADACWNVALGRYFLDSWQHMLEPWLRKVFAWLDAGGPDAARD